MVPGDRPPSWARQRLDGLARLNAARTCIDAVLVGDWPPTREVAEALAELIASAGPHLAASRDLLEASA